MDFLKVSLSTVRHKTQFNLHYSVPRGGFSGCTKKLDIEAFCATFWLVSGPEMLTNISSVNLLPWVRENVGRAIKIDSQS